MENGFLHNLDTVFWVQPALIAVRMVEEAKNGKYYLNAPTLSTNRIKITESIVIPEKTLYIVGLCLVIMLVLNLFVNKNK